MTVQMSTSKTVYYGDGVTTEFPITFEIGKPEYIHVYIRKGDNAIYETNSYDLEDNYIIYPSEEVTIADSDELDETQVLTEDDSIVITRELPLKQEMNLVNQGPFFAESIESAFDDTVMMIQQVNEKVGRALTVDLDNTENPNTVIGEIFTARTQAQASATSAYENAQNALQSEQSAGTYKTMCEQYKTATDANKTSVAQTKQQIDTISATVSGYKDTTLEYMTMASTYASNARASELNTIAKTSAAETASATATTKASEAGSYKAQAEAAADEAEASKNLAYEYLNRGLSVPIGTIIPFAGNGTLPIGFLLCDGSSVSKAQYGGLFDVIGYTYGGSGNNFNLPDLTDRFIEGSDESIGEYLDAGLPNIEGTLSDIRTSDGADASASGSLEFSATTTYPNTVTSRTGRTYYDGITLDASNSSAIYGNSSTVQPAALCLRYIIRAFAGATEGNGDITALQQGKQDKLTAGTNISIENNVISATGIGDVTKAYVDTQDNKLSAEIVKLQRKTDAIWDMGNNIFYKFETDTNAGNKTIPSGAKVMDIDGYGGKSFVANQLSKMGDVSNTKSYNDGNLIMTKNATNGTITLNGDSGTVGANEWIDHFKTTINHKYYIKGCPANGGYDKYQMVFGTSTDTGNGAIFTETTSDTTRYFTYRIAPSNTYSNLTYVPQLFDLTQMFGSGNEPTLDECKQIFTEYIPYNAGTLTNQSVEIVKIRGRNLLDLEHPTSAITGTTITKNGDVFHCETTSANARLYYLISVIPNKKYVIRAGYTSNTSGAGISQFFQTCFVYDGTDTSATALINGSAIYPSASVKSFTPSGKYVYVGITISGGSGGSIGDVSGAIITPYIDANTSSYPIVPYTEPQSITIPTDWAELKSAGSVYDERQFYSVEQTDGTTKYYCKYIKRVGDTVVDNQYTVLETPVVTTIELSENLFENITVEGNGSIEFCGTNDYNMPIPNTETYLIALAEV